jgi:DNA-binding protein Fis
MKEILQTETTQEDTMQQPQLTLRQQAKALVRGFLQLGLPYAECVRAFKKEFVVLVLVAHRGNQCRAAHSLGMHRNTLARTLAELKIDARLIRSVFLKNAGMKLTAGSRAGLETKLRTGLRTKLQAKSQTGTRTARRNSTSAAVTAPDAQIERRKLVLVTTVAHDDPESATAVASGVITQNNPVSV